MLPVPTISYHFVNAIFCFPAKFCFSFSRIAIAGCYVASTTRLYAIWHIYTIHLNKGIDHIQNTIAMACAHIVDSKTTFTLNGFQCSHMACGQVAYVDIITHASTVMGRIIVTKDSKFLTLTYSDLRDIRHQIVGNAIRILSYSSTRMGSHRIEIAK